MSLEGGGKKEEVGGLFFRFFLFFCNLRLSPWGGAKEGKKLVPFFFQIWMKRTIMPCKHWLEWTFIKVMPFLPYRHRWCKWGYVVANTYLPTIPGLRIAQRQQHCWDRYRQTERHNFTRLFHIEGFTKPCIQRWCGMYPVIGILTELGKLTFHESWQSMWSASWVHSPSQHNMWAAWLGTDTSSKVKNQQCLK